MGHITSVLISIIIITFKELFRKKSSVHYQDTEDKENAPVANLLEFFQVLNLNQSMFSSDCRMIRTQMKYLFSMVVACTWMR